MNFIVTYDSDYLKHHGILGQKWGVRRFQNEDGSVTPAGAKRYYDDTDSPKKKGLSDKTKKALKVGATVVGTAAIVAGGVYLAKKYKTAKLSSIKSTDISKGKEIIKEFKLDSPLTLNPGNSGVSNEDILRNIQSAVNMSNEQLGRAKKIW